MFHHWKTQLAESSSFFCHNTILPGPTVNFESRSSGPIFYVLYLNVWHLVSYLIPINSKIKWETRCQNLSGEHNGDRGSVVVNFRNCSWLEYERSEWGWGYPQNVKKFLVLHWFPKSMYAWVAKLAALLQGTFLLYSCHNLMIRVIYCWVNNCSFTAWLPSIEWTEKALFFLFYF